MKYKLIFAILFTIMSSIFAQSNKQDTLKVYRTAFKSVRNIKYKYIYMFVVNERVCLIENKNIGSDKYLKYQCFSRFHNNNGMDMYFQFYLEKENLLVEEGIWDFYNFNGNYKSYFKNGRLKSEGVYFQGVEIGKWIYYKKDGSVFRVINYPIKINRIEVREEQKNEIKAAINLYNYPTLQDSINFVKSVKGRWLRRYR